MAALSFKKEFIAPIQARSKTSTLRRMTSLQPGDTVDAKCIWGAPAFATLLVTDIEEVAMSDLDDDDAAADGFASLQDLCDWLDKHYPLVENFVRIKFVVLEPWGGT